MGRKSLRFLLKRAYLQVKYKYKYWLLYRTRILKEKKILLKLRSFNVKVKPWKKMGTIPIHQLPIDSPNKKKSLKEILGSGKEFITAKIFIKGKKRLNKEFLLIPAGIVVGIFIINLLQYRPDYNGLFIKQFSEEDKVCKLLLEDIQDTKEKYMGKGGAPDSELKIVMYKIKEGERLWDIHLRTGLSMDTLISMNTQKNVHILQPGQIIHIPNQDGIAYKIQEGETLESIAEEFKVEKTDILEVNDLDESSIEAGIGLFIPNGKYSLEKRINILGRFLQPLSGRITSGFGPRKILLIITVPQSGPLRADVLSSAAPEVDMEN